MNFIYQVALVYYLIAITEGKVRLTNVKCEEWDKPFATFEKCNLKLIGRGVVSLNIHVKLYQIPVTNVSMNLSFFKKANGFKPFLYNVTTDFCKYYKSGKNLSFIKIFFDLVARGSNINQTCPYNHDIIVDNLVLDSSMFQYLPLPTGEYLFKLKVAAYNDWKAEVNTYMEFKE